MATAIHVSHEAIQKIGGIGTVLHGLITSKKYQKVFPKTMLYTPLFTREGDPLHRLGRNSELLYSGIDGFDAASWRELLFPIEQKYGVRIVYGKKKMFQRRLESASIDVDIVAVDIWDMPPSIVDQFKFRLWESFGIQSDLYRGDFDYEQYLRIGIILIDIFETIYGARERAVVFSHEYMGMSSALAFELDKKDGRRRGDKTVFYAHEVSTARVVVEKHPGHDFTFYNVLRLDKKAGTPLEETFGSYKFYSRNELVKKAVHLNRIFVVSDITKDEFLYLSPETDEKKIKVVYNGIPVETIDFNAKEQSIQIMKAYCRRLFDFEPDYLFTHVTRLVISKAMWRDIRLMYYVDEHFAKNGLTGFFVILSTLVGDGRPSESVKKMEAEYGWPVYHREGWPDLLGIEVDLYKYLEIFNKKSKAIKGVFINQFGFSKERCGEAVPDKASMLTFRLASDFELGFSIYEPFGISQLETMPYGGTPVLSSSCGCSNVLKRYAKEQDYICVDFTEVTSNFKNRLSGKEDFLNVTCEMRDQIETEICRQSAINVISKLPRDNRARKARLQCMQKLIKKFDWEHVASRVIKSL